MRFLVIGLGSMGKRRIRCLQTLGHEAIGFDTREDRRKEAQEKYSITVYDDIDGAIAFDSDGCIIFRVNALIISTPPDHHVEYIKKAQQYGLPCFVEASVTPDGLRECMGKTLVVPSSTWMFHPAIRVIKEIIDSGRLGRLSNVIYHQGQYLPDWHIYEKPADYYVSNPETGAAREMVAFDLTWLTKLFGFPVKTSAHYGMTIDIEGAPIADTYNILMSFSKPPSFATLTIDVVSRTATRRLVINGSEGQLIWDWADGLIKIGDERVPYGITRAAQGYDEHIGEGMYVDETEAFIEALGGKPFPNTLEEDLRVLYLLRSIER